MAAAAVRSLDVAERQCLIDFFNDENGFFWHHRLLLKPTPVPGRWIIATPDLSVQVADLNAHRIIALERDAPIPGQYANAAYLFDPIQPAELEQVRARAVALLDILGIASAGAGLPVQPVWRVADPAHPGFDDELPAMITADRDSFIQSPDGLAAMARIDDEWVAVASVPPDEHDEWLRQKRAGAGRDSRLVGDARVNGARFMPMIDAVGASKVETVPGWPFQGERLVPEFVASMRGTGYEWMSHHLDFVSKSGIGRQSGLARIHRRISEVMTHMQCFDQLNAYNLASAELLTRYLHQIESAVRKNPKNPDMSGMDMPLSSGIDENGGIITTKYQHWVSTVQRDRAQTLKQERLYAEEQGYAISQGRGSGSGDGGGGGGRGRGAGGRDAGRGRGRGRGGDGPPGAEGG